MAQLRERVPVRCDGVPQTSTHSRRRLSVSSHRLVKFTFISHGFASIYSSRQRYLSWNKGKRRESEVRGCVLNQATGNDLSSAIVAKSAMRMMAQPHLWDLFPGRGIRIRIHALRRTIEKFSWTRAEAFSRVDTTFRALGIHPVHLFSSVITVHHS
ncbi:hypothetical protein BJV78DRAFT_520674 [Lactifluus subvellereus]|nr:hypothetical protein BJV78DRAFT_520674 [Lactifluus subvellereus]